MAGKKLFTNTSRINLYVTLLVRKSADPHDQAGMKEFVLNGGQSSWHEYGNNIDIYLNGVKLAAVTAGDMIGEQKIVVVRGSPFDNLLNTRNAVDFVYSNGVFSMSSRQVSW
jgi:hypothetical protein